MKELEVIKELPIINANFEDVKASLSETLNKYKGIIVTEEGLKDCKATQKELSSLRVKIDTYRKTIKKEVLVPVTEFESKCKELESLIVDVENPIKEGINVFDNLKREEKRTKALEFIIGAIESHELKPKYANQLNVLDKYMGLSGSVKAVKEDIDIRAESLKIQQDSEERELEQLKASIDMYITTFNEDINLKLIPTDFYKYIEKGYNITNITSLIKDQHDKIKEAENPKEEIKIEPIKQEIQIPIDINRDPQPIQQKEQLYFYDLKITANYENCKKLIELLKSGNFDYEVKEKGKV
jgi:uncharacterized membrane-anchored protein YhcB (DUF1043 family)